MKRKKKLVLHMRDEATPDQMLCGLSVVDGDRTINVMGVNCGVCVARLLAVEKDRKAVKP